MYQKVKDQGRYTLQQIMAQRGKIIVFGKKEELSYTILGEKKTIPVYPSYFLISNEGEIWDQDRQFWCTIDEKGFVHLNPGDNKSEEFKNLLRELENEGFEGILIRENLVWIKKNGEYKKLLFYSQMKEAIFLAETFEMVDTITLVEEI